MSARSSFGLVTKARTVWRAKFSLSEIANVLLDTVVIKIKKAVKNGSVNITNSAVAEPVSDFSKNLIILIFIYHN